MVNYGNQLWFIVLSKFRGDIDFLNLIYALGSVGVDMPKMIQLFSKGIEFASTRDAYELDYGLVEVPFGRVSTPFSRLSLFSHWQSTMWLYNSAINSKGNVLCIQIFSGCLECTQLTMPMEELEANFSIILKDIESCRARTSGSFVTRCYVLSPPSPEYFVVKTEAYIKKKAEDTSSSSSSDDDSDNENEKPDEEEGQNTSRARVAKQ